MESKWARKIWVTSFETAILNTSTDPLSFGAKSSSRKCLKTMESVLTLQEVCTAGGICCGLQHHLKEGNRLKWVAMHYIVKQRIIASAYSLHTNFCFHSMDYLFCKQCLCLQTEILVHFLKKSIKSFVFAWSIFLQGNIEANFTYTTVLSI